MLVVHHPDQALHDPETVFRTGKLIAQPDRCERYEIFLRVMREEGHEIVEAPLGGLGPILAVHDADYVDFLRDAYAQWSAHADFGPVAIPNVHPTHRMHRRPTDFLGLLGWYSNSTSCPIVADTWRSIFASAQSAIHAAECLTAGTDPVYALCRPSGHHAYPDLMTGACFLNNSAIAANHLVSRFGKVALLDIDVHHCNGSQFIFYQRADVLVCSVHIDPRLTAPFYAGHSDETGEGPGLGFNCNFPLPANTGDADWLVALEAALGRIVDYAPGALVVSLGFDGGEHDPVEAFKITEAGFAGAGRKLTAMKLPTLLVQEGGYLSSYLGSYLRSFMRAFNS
ncbi:histone deacetylase family protein [Hyphomonas sp.]|uniref:histone deacetylase family protein n=1 Tax=Hyphomonas sp. TaxID=87 RepID=UPI00356263A3